MNLSSVVVETRFLKLVDLNSTPHATAEVVTAALVGYLQGKGLSLDRLARGSCDGAAIMLGAHSGVAARLKESVATLADHDSLCCTLLVLSLAACDTAHKFPWFSKFENTLNQLIPTVQYVLLHMQ